MDGRMMWHRLAAVGLVIAGLAALGGSALAAGEPTAMSLGVPDAARVGDQVTLQALLVGSDGQPVPQAPVMFYTSATFLGVSGDVVVARATTGKDGLAVAQWRVSQAGKLTVRGVFPGNERYAPSEATASMSVKDATQLYAEEVGVHLPGINTPPPVAPSLFMSVRPVGLPLEGLWPAFSGWPIAVVLLTVWSLYAFSVAMTFKIAKSRGHRGTGEVRR